MRPVGWNCTISMSRSVRPARSAIAMPSQVLSPEGVWYLYMVGPPPVASSTACACTSTNSPLRMSIISTPASAFAAAVLDELDRAVLLQPPDAARPYLLGETVDDLDAGQVALVHGAIESLPRECLLVDGAVGVAVEEAAELVLQLADALHRHRDQRPGELLIGQPLAALDGVHEVALHRVPGRERDVVAALHHARAAAFAEQPLHREGDGKTRVRLVRVQRGEQPRAAGAEYQDVGLEPAHQIEPLRNFNIEPPRRQEKQIPKWAQDLSNHREKERTKSKKAVLYQ